MSEIVQDEEAISLLAHATSLSAPAEREENNPVTISSYLTHPTLSPFKSLFPILTKPRLIATTPSNLTFPGIAKEGTQSLDKYSLC